MSTRRTLFVPVAGIIGGLIIVALAGRYFSPGTRSKAMPVTTKAQPVLTAQQAHLEYVPTPIGALLGEIDRPMVTHLAIVDLDGDGVPDVLYCDARKNTVRWIRQSPRGVF